MSLAALVLGAVLSTSCSDLISEKNYSEYGSVSIFTGERAVFVEEIKSAKAKIYGFDSAGGGQLRDQEAFFCQVVYDDMRIVMVDDRKNKFHG